MESESFILQKVAQLLVDDSLNVRKQAEHTCLSCNDNERNLLIDQIISVFKDNCLKKPLQCSFIAETLLKMNKKERFTSNIITKFFNLFLIDIFPKFASSTNEDNEDSDEKTRLQEKEKFIESTIIFVQSFTKLIEGAELFFSFLFDNQNDNLLNNVYSLMLLQKVIDGISPGLELTNLLKKYYDSLINSFNATLTSKNDLESKDLTKLYENVVFSLDKIFKILSQSKFHISNQEESNINSSLNEILKSTYNKLPDESFDNNFRTRVFDLTITSSNFLSHEVFLFNTQNISKSIINLILLPENLESPADKRSALVLLALYNQIKENEKEIQTQHILQPVSKSDITKIASVLLNFLSDNKQFSEITKDNYLKAFLLVSSYIEKHSPNSVLDPSLKNLKDLKDTFETKNISSLLILNKLIEDKLITSTQKVKEICNSLNELCNKSKITSSIEATIYMFKLWTSLSHNRIIPADALKTSDIFRAISSPAIASTTLRLSHALTILSSITNLTQWDINDNIVNTYNVIKNSDEVFVLDLFNKILLQIAETSKIPELLNVSLDPKYVLAAPVAFSCMKVAEEDPCYSAELDINQVLIPRAFVYASCPFFSMKTRSDIVSVIGRLSPITKEIANKASKQILENNCRSCCQRIVNKFILDTIDQQMQSNEIPPIWIQAVLTFLDLFQKTQHPDAGRNDHIFPISYIKAAVYNIIAILFTLVKNTIGTSNVKPNPQENSSTASSIPKIADGRPLTLSSLFQPLFTKCNISDPIESVAIASALASLYNYNKQFVMDSFKAKSETRKFAQKDQGHIFILEFCSRMLDIDSNYESKVKDLLDDDSISNDIRARCLRRIIKKGKGSINSNKSNLLVTETLESNDEETLKIGLKLFLLLIKKKQIENYQESLAKAANAFYSFPKLEKITNEIFSLTPIEFNFQNFCTKIFGANSIESANYITNLVETKYSEQEQKSNVLRKANFAAAVSLMLLNPDYYDNGKKLAEIIFNFRNSSEEFPLTFYCSSEPNVSEEFVLKLFNCLKFFDPWNELAVKAILLIAKDSRFDRVVPSCTDEFLKIIGQIPKSSISNVSKKLASILFEKDKFNYVNKILFTKPLTTNNQFISISILIEEIGPTIFAIAMKHKVEQPLYSNVLSIIRQASMPDNIQLSSIIFIIFTISQILSISISNDKNAAINRNDILRLYDDCLKSLKYLSAKFPLIDSPRVQKVLNQTKELLTNSSISDLDDEENNFKLIRSLFSVCPNEITIFHISFFTEISPVGAIAGYTEMIHQGRPLLTEILSIGQKAKRAALFAIPNLKLLEADRYGEAQLGQLFDFILDNLSFAPAEGFNCILQLFDWIPKNVLFDKCDKMFINTQKVIRKIGCIPIPPQNSDSNSTGAATRTRPAQAPTSSLLSPQKNTLPQNLKKSQTQPQQAQSDDSNILNSNTLYKFNINDVINALNCLTRYSDSLTFSSRAEFKNNIPYYLVYSYCYSSIDVSTTGNTNNYINDTISNSMTKGEPFIVPAARKALLTLCQFSGMTQTAQTIQKNLTIDDEKNVEGEKIILKNRFLIEISKTFVQEMDLRCLDAAFAMIDEEQRNTDVKIAATFLICASIHEKKGLERNLHLRLLPLLSASDNAKLRMGVLRAIKNFPMIL